MSVVDLSCDVGKLRIEMKKIKEKLQQIESVIDDYHGTCSWSPFDKYEEVEEK